MICDFITRNKIFTRDDPLPREKKNKNYGGGGDNGRLSLNVPNKNN